MGCFLVWRKPWLIRLCFVVWASAQCLFESLVLLHLVIAHASNIKKLLMNYSPKVSFSIHSGESVNVITSSFFFFTELQVYT